MYLYVCVQLMHLPDPMAPHPGNLALNCVKFSGMLGLHPLATVVGACARGGGGGTGGEIGECGGEGGVCVWGGGGEGGGGCTGRDDASTQARRGSRPRRRGCSRACGRARLRARSGAQVHFPYASRDQVHAHAHFPYTSRVRGRRTPRLDAAIVAFAHTAAARLSVAPTDFDAVMLLVCVRLRTRAHLVTSNQIESHHMNCPAQPTEDDLIRYKVLAGVPPTLLQARFALLKYLNRLVTPLLNYVDITVAGQRIRIDSIRSLNGSHWHYALSEWCPHCIINV